MCFLGGCRAWLKKRGILHLINLIVGFGLYVCDVVLDIYVAIQYARKDEWWWFAFTLAFVMLPFIIFNFLNYGATRGLTFAPSSMFFLLKGYVHNFRQWKRKYWGNELGPCGISCYTKCLCERCIEKRSSALSSFTLAFARHFETMTESAPQWCLQNYVMLRQWYFPWYKVLSTVFSFLSLTWSIISLEKAEKTHRWFYESYPTTSINTVFFAWQFCSLLSRLSALVFFAYVFRYHVFVLFGLHLILLTIASYIARGHVHYLASNYNFLPLLKYIYCSYYMMFYISGRLNRAMFGNCFIHRKWFLFLYQIALCLQNILLVSLAVWHAPAGTTHNKHLEIIVLCFVFVGLVLSIIFMALYYQCFHPSKTLVQNCEEKPTHSGEVEQNCVDSTLVYYITGL